MAYTAYVISGDSLEALLATFLYMAGAARVGAAWGGSFIHLIPVYGALLSTLFLGEEVHAVHSVGMASILSGLAVSNARAYREVSTAEAPSTGTVERGI